LQVGCDAALCPEAAGAEQKNHVFRLDRLGGGTIDTQLRYSATRDLRRAGPRSPPERHGKRWVLASEDIGKTGRIEIERELISLIKNRALRTFNNRQTWMLSGNSSHKLKCEIYFTKLPHIVGVPLASQARTVRCFLSKKGKI
jgi:hypothetical protein